MQNVGVRVRDFRDWDLGLWSPLNSVGGLKTGVFRFGLDDSAVLSWAILALRKSRRCENEEIVGLSDWAKVMERGIQGCGLRD